MSFHFRNSNVQILNDNRLKFIIKNNRVRMKIGNKQKRFPRRAGLSANQGKSGNFIFSQGKSGTFKLLIVSFQSSDFLHTQPCIHLSVIAAKFYPFLYNSVLYSHIAMQFPFVIKPKI